MFVLVCTKQGKKPQPLIQLRHSSALIKPQFVAFCILLSVKITGKCRGGKSTHILYFSRSTDTCVKTDSGKGRGTD